MADEGVSKDATPRHFFVRRLTQAIVEQGVDTGRTFPELPENAFKIQGRFGDIWPEDAADLQRWSEGRGPGDLPLRWDPAARRFMLLREQAIASSDAILRFTWY